MTFEEYKMRRLVWEFKQACRYYGSTRKAIKHGSTDKQIGWGNNPIWSSAPTPSVTKWVWSRWRNLIINKRNAEIAAFIVLYNCLFGEGVPVKVRKWAKSLIGGA